VSPGVGESRWRKCCETFWSRTPNVDDWDLVLMSGTNFGAAWPDYFDLIADIQWTPPIAHADLFKQPIQEDQTAYFYAIVSQVDTHWVTHYIGMTHRQAVSVRNQQRDHRERLARLQSAHTGHTFMLTLGSPIFKRGRSSLQNISAIEGLLIYAHWHDEMENRSKIQRIVSRKHIHIRNTGWNAHLKPEVAVGVFCAKLHST
jgi:hypothetical protein